LQSILSLPVVALTKCQPSCICSLLADSSYGQTIRHASLLTKLQYKHTTEIDNSLEQLMEGYLCRGSWDVGMAYTTLHHPLMTTTPLMHLPPLCKACIHTVSNTNVDALHASSTMWAQENRVCM
jgi:hypothetical protein